MTRIELYEWVAAKLLVRSARRRASRSGPGDAHELLHLWAALNAGNSDPCNDSGNCTLTMTPEKRACLAAVYSEPSR